MNQLHGLYLVVSPVLPTKRLLAAAKEALVGGVDLVQYSAGSGPADSGLAGDLAGLAEQFSVPFLVNNDLALAQAVHAGGVHFDNFAVPPTQAKAALGKDAYIGYTVSDDLEKVKFAEAFGADYVSFCSVFGCKGVSCPLVSLSTIATAKTLVSLPVFGAGGVTLQNLPTLLEAGVDGVTVTSAVLTSPNPKQAAEEFKKILKKYGKS